MTDKEVAVIIWDMIVAICLEKLSKKRRF